MPWSSKPLDVSCPAGEKGKRWCHQSAKLAKDVVPIFASGQHPERPPTLNFTQLHDAPLDIFVHGSGFFVHLLHVLDLEDIGVSHTTSPPMGRPFHSSNRFLSQRTFLGQARGLGVRQLTEKWPKVCPDGMILDKCPRACDCRRCRNE